MVDDSKIGAVIIGAAMIVAACSGGGDTGPDGTTSSGSSGASSSSGSTSSGSSGSSGASSGGGGSCTPALGDHYFDDAGTVPDATLTVTPCPSGYLANDNTGGTISSSDVSSPPRRFTNQADLTAALCRPDPNAHDGGTTTTPIDFATVDVIAIEYLSYGGGPSLVSVAGKLWVRRQANFCGGAQPQHVQALYRVPKGAEVEIENCSVACGPCCAP